MFLIFFFSSRRRHTRLQGDWSSDVCSSDLSALVLAAEWPSVSQVRWERFHEALVSARVKVTPAQADSAYRAGTVRLFQHILIRVPPNAAPPQQDKQRKQAEGLLLQAAARHGAHFALRA